MYGPGLIHQAHQVDEYVEKDVYLTFIDFVYRIFPYLFKKHEIIY